MTSCFGTLSTMTRRSTLRICCMTGTTTMIPGPLMPVKRPSVNITPRSYSFSTLMTAEEQHDDEDDDDDYERHEALRSSRFYRRLDPQCQSFHLHDARRLAGLQLPLLRAFHSSPP